tara:strand:- start:15310 stop:16704 length:1395 start_codon:yes stop_codon:yes gene_type:complete
MRSIVSNDANQKGSLEEEGFVSDNADVPCRGHLGFFAVFQGEVNYADLVERGRELGLPGYSGPSLGEDRSAAHSHGDNGHLHWGLNGNRWDWSSLDFDWDGWIPRPRSGSKAFANAVKDLNRSVGFVETEDWEDAQGRRRARVSYEVVMLRNNKEFKLVRRWRGKNVASGRWDSITEDLFRIQFVPPERGSHLQRWRQRYVHQTLTGNPPKDMPRAEPSELSALYEVTPFDASVSVSPEQIQQVNRTLRLALLRECTTVDQDGLRSIIRRAIKDVGGMQFGGSSGGVYYIPDWNNTQHYMQALVPFSELINWFGEQNYQVEEYVEDEDGSWVRQQRTPPTTFRLLGYVESARQMEYLRQDIAREVVSSVNDYYDDLVKVVSQTTIEDLPREIDRLWREQRTLRDRLGNMHGIIGDSINEALAPHSGVQAIFDERLGAITTGSQQQANRLRQLMRIELRDENGDE